MIQDLPLAQQVSLTTARIVCDYGSGQSGFGTGFLFNCCPDASENLPLLVTNRHVVTGAVRLWIHLTRAGEDGVPLWGQKVQVEWEGTTGWVNHPDGGVDLAAFPVGSLLNRLAGEGKQFVTAILNRRNAPAAEEWATLSAMEDIVMIGYPIGLWDSANNMPIFHRGITATHPSMDYEGRKEFLIDAACFPGSSGSPVFLYKPGLNLKGGEGITTTGGGPMLRLLGVLWGGPQHQAEGRIEAVPIPTNWVPIALMKIPANLGFVIKVQRLFDFWPLLQPQAGGE